MTGIEHGSVEERTASKQTHDTSRDLIEERHFAQAAELLTEADTIDMTGERQALLGLANFHLEKYELAATHYESAIGANPTSPQLSAWTDMVALCRHNAASEVDVPVPPIHYHERANLLGPPEHPTLPTPPPRARRKPIQEFHLLVGHLIGSLFGGVFTWLTKTFGKNYRDDVWTNWYRKRLYLGILTLAHMREKLNENNLRSTYPPDVKVAFQPDGLSAPAGVTHYRTADGSWNNLDDPKEGAAGTRFPRNVDNSVIKPATDEELMRPNPRLISQKLLSRGKDGMKEVPFLNLLAASWIQFQNHDWVSHGENQRDAVEVIEVPFPDGDPARERFRQSKMFIARTQPDPTRQPSGEPTPATFVNEVTHWWDGSQIYGSDQATQDRLRSGIDGKLIVDEDRLLPVGGNGVEDTGMNRNWWVGLAMLHNLFVLEHNAICERLKATHPDWADDRLFNVARLVNAAVMAKIHSIEWTPAILANRALDMGLNMNWYGGLTYRFRSPEHRKTVATYNVSNPELGGLVGNKIDKHGEAYGLAEEFVEVYRLHSLLPEALRVRDATTGKVLEDLPVAATRQAASPKISQQYGMTDPFYSFGNQHPGQLVLNNYPKFMQELSVPGNPVFDMGTVDIVRARERGIPRYNEFRRQLGLNPLRTFEDLTSDPDTLATLREIYDDVEDIDLMIGTLGEETRPTNFGFGETMFQIFILNASRRLQADRFYTDCYTEEVYTKEGLAWVDATTFKTVILRHFPALADSGLGNVTNAFEPWDTGTLDPSRHPLRAYNKELKKDPWRGDAAPKP